MRASFARHGRLGAAMLCAAATCGVPAQAAADAPPPAPGAAPAPGPGAAELEREAHDAFNRGEFAVAARAFEALHRAAPHASLKLNAGLAWDKAGDPARAADAYAAALAAGGLDAEREKRARTHLTQLEQRLGAVSVEGPAGASARVDGEAAGALPIRVHVSPGEHVIEVVRTDGTSEQQRVTVRAGESRVVNVAAGKPTEPPPPAPPATSPPSSPSRMRVGGWVTIGLSAAFAGAAIGLGVHTKSVNAAFMSGGNVDRQKHDEAVTFRALTNVTWGVAAASAIAGVVLVAAAPRAKPSPAAALQVGLAPTGATLRFSF